MGREPLGYCMDRDSLKSQSLWPEAGGSWSEGKCNGSRGRPCDYPGAETEVWRHDEAGNACKLSLASLGLQHFMPSVVSEEPETHSRGGASEEVYKDTGR